MSAMVTLPVNDIPEPDRRSLENLLGLPLEADQQVFVMAFSADQVPDEATRCAATARIRQTLAEVDRYRITNSIPDEEVDAAIDEAMHQIRQRSG